MIEQIYNITQMVNCHFGYEVTNTTPTKATLKHGTFIVHVKVTNNRIWCNGLTFMLSDYNNFQSKVFQLLNH